MLRFRLKVRLKAELEYGLEPDLEVELEAELEAGSGGWSRSWNGSRSWIWRLEWELRPKGRNPRKFQPGGGKIRILGPNSGFTSPTLVFSKGFWWKNWLETQNWWVQKLFKGNQFWKTSAKLVLTPLKKLQSPNLIYIALIWTWDLLHTSVKRCAMTCF